MKFLSLVKDGKSISVKYEDENKKISKARYSNPTDRTIENLNFISAVCDAQEDGIDIIEKMIKMGMLSCKEEFDFYLKIYNRCLGVLGGKENFSSKEFGKAYLFLSDTGSGKSHIISKILVEKLSTEKKKYSFDKIKRILSGNTETTKNITEYILRKPINKADINKIKVEFKFIDDVEQGWVANEIITEAYKRYLKSKEISKSRCLIPKQVLQATFRTDKLFSKEDILEIEEYLRSKFETLPYVKDQLDEEFIEGTKGMIVDKIIKILEKEKIGEKDYLELSEENLLSVFQSIKEKFSLIDTAKITFYIDIEEPSILIDTIGLNHGEKAENVDRIRLRNLASLLVKNKDANIVYVIDATRVTQLVLEPIEMLYQFGRFSTTKFLISKTDLLDDFDSIQSFIEEKIEDNEYLDNEFLDYLKNNSYASASDDAYKILLESVVDINVTSKEYKVQTSEENFTLEINEFKRYLDRKFTNAHWHSLDSYLFKIINNREDEHIDKNFESYSISGNIRDIFTQTFKSERIEKRLMDYCTEKPDKDTLNEMKKQFWIALTKVAYVYFIEKNMNEIIRIYNIRSTFTVRNARKSSMTRERLMNFKNLYYKSDIELNSIFSGIISVSLGITIDNVNKK
ncbi:MAG: hypothetical protein ACRCWM_04090 [Sarcina sp.]